jgi:hypothetical protein
VPRDEVRLVSRRHFRGGEIVLWRHTEGIGDTIQESKKGSDVYRFRNLFLCSSDHAQLFDVFRRGAVSGMGNQFPYCNGDTRPASAVLRLTCLRRATVRRAQESAYALRNGDKVSGEITTRQLYEKTISRVCRHDDGYAREYFFRIIDCRLHVPIIAALQICGRILARFPMRRESVLRNQLRFVRTNMEKHA